MSLVSNVTRALRNRPYMLPKYATETVSFKINNILVRILKGKNVTLGPHCHIASPLVFRAERPHARIVVGDYIIAWKRSVVNAWGNGVVSIGDTCSIGSNTTINCRERVSIGRNVLISWNVQIADFDGHSLDLNERLAEIEHTKLVYWPDPSKGAFTPRFVTRPIVIEDGVWIGAHAIILKGAKIGRGAVIGAGSVVSGEIPPLCVAAGNPARVVKQLATEK